MISHKHNFFFVSVPKTGSSSVEIALRKYCISMPPSKKHFTYDEYINNKEDKELINFDYFSFAFVRNPFDRLVSQFFFSGRRFWNKYGLNQGSFCFKNYVEKIVSKNIPFSSHRYESTKSNKLDKDWSQLQFVSPNIDFIGKLENIQQDFDVVCDKIGIPQQQLPHENKTAHRHYTEYYDDETRKIVAEKCAKDIKYFGYKFGE